MSYHPPAGAIGHAVTSILGVDPKRSMDDDLVRFNSLLGNGKTTTIRQEVATSDLFENNRVATGSTERYRAEDEKPLPRGGGLFR